MDIIYELINKQCKILSPSNIFKIINTNQGYLMKLSLEIVNRFNTVIQTDFNKEIIF